ncbi:heme biosynthesis HemY N-terminal domain-containing protein [Variovorax sp. YR752]|uniref:heme biosynthesis HemY N-terminal domain-containing protein n=1 Tax=Variovorax sp. YR752 TaxID=1884383 RepID=UPI003137FB93
MRSVIWFVLLFVVAVVAASTLGANDGLVSFYWSGQRVDLSLNLFLILLVVICAVLVTVFNTLNALIGLPQRAREWRVARRDRTAQASLREALSQYFGGRYSRAQKAAQRALAIQSDTPELVQDNEFTVLGHLLAAGSAHRLQDRASRDRSIERALELARQSAAARSAEEGARLLAAEWALDDRDATRALELLGELPTGVARRTHALRLRLQATRLGRQPQEALKTARLLAKHQGFSKEAAQGLLRSLAFESLDTARDAEQLRRVWTQLDALDRRDAFVAARAATRAAGYGASDEARGWLRPFWERLAELAAEERAALALAFAHAVAGLGVEWLPRLEAAAQAYGREPAMSYAVGMALAERQLWGKARRLLDEAAGDASLPAPARRKAWRTLASIAAQEGDAERAARAHEAAARLD